MIIQMFEEGKWGEGGGKTLKREEEESGEINIAAVLLINER